MSFKTFLIEQEQLNEKLIVIGNGKRNGQVVFMGGGGGSGKDFAIKQFMEDDKFKVIDQDELIRLFIELEKLKGGEFKDADLTDPDVVTIVYDHVKYVKKWKGKRLALLFNDLREGMLPNIIFNTTLAWTDTLPDYIPKLQKLGYKLNDIHLVWVLADYKIALERNAVRSRRIHADILIGAHEGAANNMYDVLFKKKDLTLNGGIYVVLNNKQNIVYWEGSKSVIKDFTYLTLKKPGKPRETRKEVSDELMTWIRNNVPKTENTKELFESDEMEDVSKQFGRKLSKEIIEPDRWQSVKNHKLAVPGYSVDLVTDLDLYADAIFKKNGKAFLMQRMIPPTSISKFIRKINNDKSFIEYLEEISRDI